MIQPPDEVVALLAQFDSREDTFEVIDVQGAIARSIERDKVQADQRDGFWAEIAAFAFDTHPAPDKGPWGTYFQPESTFQRSDGSEVYRPDIDQVDSRVLDYWASRAKAVKHPVLAARYADLVWDFSRRVTKKAAPIEFARLAIDSYVAAIEVDDGTAWGDNFYNLKRMLGLALSIRDVGRTVRAVEATISYADKTSEDHKLGTYCYLFDNLLPASKGPELTEEQERGIVKMFEAKFETMTDPNGPWQAEPYATRDVGLRLAGYYRRKGDEDGRSRVQEEIGRAFERRCDIGDALTGLFFLEEARKHYLEAGRRDEAERVQLKAQGLAPEAEKRMVRSSVEVELPEDHRKQFEDSLLQGGIENGLGTIAAMFIVDQDRLQEELEQLASQSPLQALFPPKVIGDDGIKADIDDTSGDPDGRLVWETSKRVQLSSLWLSWGLDHLIENGLQPEELCDFLGKSPLFGEDRLPLVLRGVRAHFLGDYVQSVHLLVPQIERAIVGMTRLLGGSSVKRHRSGRAVTQAKSLNDALEDEAVVAVLGPDLTMYLLATLSHPKGLNIRNEVCHGLWGPDRFNKATSERLLHILVALSLIRARTDESTRGQCQAKTRSGARCTRRAEDTFCWQHQP